MPDLDAPKRLARNGPTFARFEKNFSSLSKFFSIMSNPDAMVEVWLRDDLASS